MAVYYPVTPGRHHEGAGHHPVAPQWGTSPGYIGAGGLVSYAPHTSTHSHMGGPHQHQQYQHSPSTLPQQPTLRPPSAASQTPLSHHWQQQLIKYESSRASAAPHHRARTSAMTMRSSAKAAITIMDPNTHKRAQGSISDRTDASTDDGTNGTNGTTPGTPTNGHPSSTAAPVVSSPPLAARPTTIRSPEQTTWTTLDMGGMRLKNLSASLFKLDYITTLYVNHNQLSSLSPEISKLRSLVHLDISSNQLTSLPPDLGMCTSLKELLFFDNAIETLPHQLGSLHQLTMLGIEGNPLQQNLRAILQKEGTQALIAYLRDSCPVPHPPPERGWKVVPSQAQRELLDQDPTSETFSLLCYNILCERYATSTMYGYTPSWALSWDYRKDLILVELVNYEADFLCLQEVDFAQYEDYFTPRLEQHGYAGIFAYKSRARTMNETQRRLVDGCATFYKKDKYALVEERLIEFNQPSRHNSALRDPSIMTEDMYNRVLTKDNIGIVALLENKQSGSRLIIANVHIHWDPEFRDVKMVQAAFLMEHLEQIAGNFAQYPPRLLHSSSVLGHDGAVNGSGSNGVSAEVAAAAAAAAASRSNTGNTSTTSSSPSPSPSPEVSQRKVGPKYDHFSKIPMIVCGDFNSIPSSGVYEYLSNGFAPGDHEDFMDHRYGKYTDEGIRHSFNLKSAYSSALGGNELPITNYTPSFKGVIDYIWYSNLNMSVEAVLGEVDEKYLEKVVGFPNAHFPSDHVCIISEFRLNKVKESSVPNGRPAAFADSNSRPRR